MSHFGLSGPYASTTRSLDQSVLTVAWKTSILLNTDKIVCKGTLNVTVSL